MFWDKDRDYLEITLSSTRYLGRQAIAEEILDLLQRYGGVYLPEKWDTQEPARRTFATATRADVMDEWIAPKKMQYIVFYRKRPVEVQMSFRIERFGRAKFNEFTAYIRDEYFREPSKVNELLCFCIELCNIISPDYGFIAHTLQERRQSPILTPAERLPGVYWANFFGKPYLDFFGRDKLLRTPCHDVREINPNLFLILTDESPLGEKQLESDAAASQIKSYLNRNAFAGPNFPDEPCAVPEFDFSDVRWSTEYLPEEPLGARVLQIRKELEDRGYKLIVERVDKIIMRGRDGSVVAVDLKGGEVSLDTTGTFLDKPDSN